MIVIRSALAVLSLTIVAAAQAGEMPLTGSWTLVQADVLFPDGRQAHDYGEMPKGLLMIDAQGRYSLQIFNSERPKFASGDKAKGTAEEYKADVMGISTHFGTLSVDTMAHVLTLHMDGASYPNQEGGTQKRFYELKGDELSYKVEPRADGSVPISVWRRLK
jgi:hypothetical protein